MVKKLLKISIAIFAVLCVVSTVVNALSFSVVLTPKSTYIKEATEFTVTIKLSNLDVGSNGLNSLTGTLSYDTSIFETITDSSIDGLNNWNATYNVENGKISLYNITKANTDSDVLQITFKTKSGVTGKSGVISLKSIVGNNNAQDISAPDVSITINIGEEVKNTTNTSLNTLIISTRNNNTTTNNVNNVTNNTTVNKVNNVTNKVVNKVTNSTIPETGVNDTIMCALFVVIAVSIVCYIRYRKLSKEM